MKTELPPQLLNESAQVFPPPAPLTSAEKAFTAQSNLDTESRDPPRRTLDLIGATAYAAPTVGSYFFYIPMWSILPSMYGKYFGLSLSSIAASVLFIRLFDGFIDTTVGYLADLHRSTGGSRKPWAIVGGLGTVGACYFLFTPPHPASMSYYITWAFVYYLLFTIAEIPHLTWGSELTLDYQDRSKVYGIRNLMTRIGIIAFYSMPLLPIYTSTEYTPEVLKDAVYVGGFMTLLGLVLALLRAPGGLVLRHAIADNPKLFISSLIGNRPLLLYFLAFALIGLSSGMWNGLLYFYLDGYLALGRKLALIFSVSTVAAALSVPLWVRLIRITSKSTTWTLAIAFFCGQMICMLMMKPGGNWWGPLLLVMSANLCFSGHDIAALSLLGDIVDYGKLKFHKDRGTIYFALSILIFKIGLGVGGGVSIGIASLFGFHPSDVYRSDRAITGLKLGFTVLPACLAFAGLLIILTIPINRRRHHIIERRLQSRMGLT